MIFLQVGWYLVTTGGDALTMGGLLDQVLVVFNAVETVILDVNVMLFSLTYW